MADKILCYSELIQLQTFEERFEYLKIGNQRIGIETFGGERFLNQQLYRDPKYRAIRNEVIIRDGACDLAMPDRIIDPKSLQFITAENKKFRAQYVFVHHMNPITIKDVIEHSKYAWDPEYMITCSFGTHNAIHYGCIDLTPRSEVVERTPNDTCPWKN